MIDSFFLFCVLVVSALFFIMSGSGDANPLDNRLAYRLDFGKINLN
jgi:hypothetical protein